VQRVEQQFERYDIREIKYATSMYDPIFSITNKNGQPLIQLTTELEGLDIYYSFDNSFPDRFYPKYTVPLTPPTDAYQFRTIVYRGNQPIGRMITMSMEEINKRSGIKKPAPAAPEEE
jgi:hexosaminidase